MTVPSADVAPARLYAPTWRWAAGLAAAVSAASLPLILAAVVLATDPPIGPILLVQLVAVGAALPGLAAWLVRRLRAAHVELRGADLVLRRSGLLAEVPLNAIVRIAPWLLPLPEPGLIVWMRSGNRLREAIGLHDPTALLDALAARNVADAAIARRHPSVLYARSAADRPPWRWYHYLWKFAGFALAPTAVLFNAHQHIAYGGTFGEYYLIGPAAYLRTFMVYWTMVVIHLVLYAGAWRAGAEAAALLTCWVVPAHAATSRRLAERGCQLVYYAGVPALLAVRFLS